MTQKQLAIRAVLEAQTWENKHIVVATHNEVVSKLSGRPNWNKESNGLAQVDSFRNYENNVINSYNR